MDTITHWLSALPAWGAAAIASTVALFASLLVGQFLQSVICRQLVLWARKTPWQWDEIVVRAIRRGVPFWSLLVGAHLAAGFWPLPMHLADALQRCLYVLAAGSAIFLAADAAGQMIVLYGSRIEHALPVTSLTQNVARLIIVIIGGLMLLSGLGLSITPLLTALGVGGLAVALALQDTLSNLFAGFYITVARQVRVGDYIKLESGQDGYVHDIGWRSTTLKMLPNNMVIVPNATLGQAIITNFYLPDKELAVPVDIGVEYGSDLERIERVTCEVARDVQRTVAGAVPAFEPFIRYHTFGDFSVNCTVILRGQEFVDQHLIKHEFVKRLHVRYAQEGISIAFPTRRVIQVEGRA